MNSMFFYLNFDRHWSPFTLYGKEQHEHSTKYLLLCFMDTRWSRSLKIWCKNNFHSYNKNNYNETPEF